jgi:mono/diheme cytochrome c family protein
VNSILKPVFATFLVALLFFSANAYAASKKADEQTGANLFRDKGCAFCHGAGGVGGKRAPSLLDLRKNKLWPPEKLTGQILDGGQKMPPFRDSLTDSEVAELVAYLRAKSRPAPAPAATPAPPPAP